MCIKGHVNLGPGVLGVVGEGAVRRSVGVAHGGPEENYVGV